jgi:hypothetical protein
MTPRYNPPWLYLLNALQVEWRTSQILKDQNPDPDLEKHLRDKGVWPPPKVDWLPLNDAKQSAV